MSEKLAAHSAPEPGTRVGGPLAPWLLQLIQAAALQGFTHRLQAAVGLRQDVSHAGGQPAGPAPGRDAEVHTGGAGEVAVWTAQPGLLVWRPGKRAVRSLGFSSLRVLLPPPSPETAAPAPAASGLSACGPAQVQITGQGVHAPQPAAGSAQSAPAPPKEVTQKKEALELPPPKTS